MTAYFDEQRTGKAEAGVHFLLVTCSLGKQRKVTRQKGEKQPNKQPQTPRHQYPPKTHQQGNKETAKAKNNLLLQSPHPCITKLEPKLTTAPSPSTLDKKASTQTGAGF